MAYYSEIEKIMERLLPYYFEGKVIDIGSADHKCVPWAIAVDRREMSGVDVKLNTDQEIYKLSERAELLDASCVMSSHCLEHLVDDYAALLDWSNIIKKGGYLILYLPDGRYYDNNNNPDHFRDYTYESFIFFFNRCFCGDSDNHNYPPIFKLIECGQDIGDDKYSFYLVAQKL